MRGHGKGSCEFTIYEWQRHLRYDLRVKCGANEPLAI